MSKAKILEQATLSQVDFLEIYKQGYCDRVVQEKGRRETKRLWKEGSLRDECLAAFRKTFGGGK